MRFRKKAFLGKVAIATVSVVLVVMLLRRNETTVEFSQGPLASYDFKHLLPEGFNSLVDLTHNVVVSAQKCVSSIRNLQITANFTMNSVLDSLVISYRPWGKSKLEPMKGVVPESEPLQVIVMPHSHNDPGWKKTYQKYFDDQTTYILSNIVTKMNEFPDMTFVWVESCFLDKWWTNQTAETKQKFKDLVESGRLEITSGMWVAPDEASPHYFALVDQLIEGHYWVKKNLGVVPESSLNFDQFGYSSTMPYLAKKAGLKNVLIKRIHRAVKELFGEKNQMNFHWRQFWDPEGHSDIFAHVDTYEWMSISDSCGPDRAVCRGLDFMNMPDLPIPGSRSADRPMQVDHASNQRVANFHEFVRNLVEQFRLKNANYKYRVMMLPHGGDFRFDTKEEWDRQYHNLKVFMQYVNEHTEFNVKMKFGTLKDYFIEIDKQDVKYDLEYPIISGDFYTYTENSEYWTGYFTTRQFDKRLGREVLESLRVAELFTSILFQDQKISVDERVRKSILDMLVKSRQDLGVFQHHDAITGTSQAHVAEDYEKLLSSAFTNTQRVMSLVTEMLLTGATSDYLLPGYSRVGHNKLTEKVPIPVIAPETKLVLVNSLLQSRKDIVSVSVKTDRVALFDPKGNAVKFDIFVNPTGAYSMRFMVEFPPVSVLTYTLKSIEQSGIAEKVVAVETPRGTSDSYFCQNDLMNVTYSRETGSPTQVCYTRADFCGRLQLDWRYYHGFGGAYTMMSNGADAPASRTRPNVKFVKRNLTCGVEVDYGFFSFEATLPLIKSVVGRALRVEVLSDLTRTSNFIGDLAMRVGTEIKSNRYFYVDSNGLQLMGRKFRDNIPFDGNVYPMSAMSMLEDDNLRVIVHSAQPHGVVSRTSGIIDFMLDRLQTRPEMDMPEPVKDNKPTKTLFFVEMQTSSEFEKSSTPESTLPSVNSMFLNDVLQHPIYKFYSVEKLNADKTSVIYLRQPVSCDIIVANVKNLAYSENVYDGTSLTLFRRAVSCQGNVIDNFCPVTESGSVQPGSMFSRGSSAKVREMYLSHLLSKKTLSNRESVHIEPMDIKTFHIGPT